MSGQVGMQYKLIPLQTVVYSTQRLKFMKLRRCWFDFSDRL